jgi:hypothetical protein
VSGLEVIAVIGIIGYIIFRQIQGEPLRGKRAVLLPAILTLIGFMNLRSGGAHLGSADIACIVIGAAGSAAIGLAFGAVTRLQSRDGYLWAQLPLRGLWLWAALVGWRVLVMLVATGMHAHVAASAATLLLSLGINRLAQAVVIVPRAMAMGIPFAPEKNGRVFMADTFNLGGLGDGLSGLGNRFSGRDDQDGDFSDVNRDGRFNRDGGGYGYYNDAGGYESRDRYDDSRRRRARPQPWDRS